MKSGKCALKKVDENNVILAKSIRDLQDNLNLEKNKSSKTEVEKKILECNTDRLEEIIVINEEKQEPKDRRMETTEEKCRFFEANGWCRFGSECHNLHPKKNCEWFQKAGKCPFEKCKDLHSQRDCPYWMRGFCRNEKCRMKHDPELKGNSKRDRSRSPNKSPADKKMKTDTHFNTAIEERLNKQE